MNSDRVTITIIRDYKQHNIVLLWENEILYIYIYILNNTLGVCAIVSGSLQPHVL